MVVPKECFHLGSLIDDRHHGEVVGIVPTPGDVEEVSLGGVSILEENRGIEKSILLPYMERHKRSGW